jgi:quinol monooxygenase YgiN
MRLLAVLKEATDRTVKGIPGFVSANLHVSLDGEHVVNYAEWSSKEDFERAMQNSKFQEHMNDVKQLVESFDPVLYELRYSAQKA